jgi:DNA-directed RNA polymerase subunit K/omega
LRGKSCPPPLWPALSGQAVSEGFLMRYFKAIEKKAAETVNQYSLVLAIAKRVRHIRSGAPTLSEVPNPLENPVEAALEEFAESQIAYSVNGSEEGAGAANPD